MKDKIKIKLLKPEAKIPIKSKDYAVGFDIFSAEETVLKAKSFKSISTGFCLEMPSYIEGQVRPRSGLAQNYGITVLNSPGTIDPDYRGEVKVILINHSDTDFKIEIGTKIAQLVFSKIIKTKFKLSQKLSDSDRGEGGFGSTGLY